MVCLLQLPNSAALTFLCECKVRNSIVKVNRSTDYKILPFMLHLKLDLPMIYMRN